MSMMHHRYVGLDVHRATISVAVAESEGAPVSYGTIANEPAAVRKLMARLGGTDRRLHVASSAFLGGPREVASAGDGFAAVRRWMR